VAWVCDERDVTGNQTVTINYDLVAEARDPPVTGCVEAVPQQHVISGTVSGLAGATARVSASFIAAPPPLSAAAPDFALSVDSGTANLLGARTPTGSALADTVYVRRGLALDADQVIDIDFDADVTLVQATTSALVDVQGTVEADELLQVAANLRTGDAQIRMSTSPTAWAGISSLGAADLLVVRASAATEATFRAASDSRRTVADVSLTLPARLSINGPTIVATSPYLRHSASWTAVAGTQRVGLALVQGAAPARSWVVQASAGWLAGATSLVVPDISTIVGWVNAWSPVSGSAVTWIMALSANSEGLFGDLGQPHTSWVSQSSGALAP
jgi:hypothetical protein